MRVPHLFLLSGLALGASVWSEEAVRIPANTKIRETESVQDVQAILPGGVSIQLIESNNLINATRARNSFHVTGAGRMAVVLDTGVNTSHVDFANKWVGIGNLVDNNGDGVVDAADGSGIDDNGHGSNVAGIICANGQHTGIAPGASLISWKVMDKNGSGDFGAIVTALNWVNQYASIYNIGSVNMSLGDGGNYKAAAGFTELETLLVALRQRGVAVTVAAGNSYCYANPADPSLYSYYSQTGMSYPAAFWATISVGAVYDAALPTGYGYNYGNGRIAYGVVADQITPFSQRLPMPFYAQFPDGLIHDSSTKIFAPGAGLKSTGWTSATHETTMHGTSQAAPCVSGAVLLFQEYFLRTYGSLPSIDLVESRLRSTSRVINDGDDENDSVLNTGANYPRVDVFALLDSINIAPAISGPNAVAALTGAATSLSQTAVDANLDYPITWQVSPISGVTVAIQTANQGCSANLTLTAATAGVYSLNLIATDAAGKSTSKTITLSANRPPVANAGPDQSVEATGPNGTSVTLNGASSQDPDGQVLTFAWRNGAGQTVSTSAVASLTLGLGTQSFSLQVTDTMGASSADTVVVTVVDTTPPVLTLLGDNPATVEAGSSFADPGATATDIEDPNVSITVSGQVGLTTGTYSVTYTAKDRSGNSTQAVRMVKVVDTTKPTLAIDLATHVLAPADDSMLDVGMTWTVQDSSSIAKIFFSVTQDEVQGKNGLEADAALVTDKTGHITGLQLRAKRANNGDGRVYLVMVTAVDTSGNSSSAWTTASVAKGKKSMQDQIDTAQQNGKSLAYDSLLIATGEISCFVDSARIHNVPTDSIETQFGYYNRGVRALGSIRFAGPVIDTKVPPGFFEPGRHPEGGQKDKQLLKLYQDKSNLVMIPAYRIQDMDKKTGQPTLVTRQKTSTGPKDLNADLKGVVSVSVDPTDSKQCIATFGYIASWNSGITYPIYVTSNQVLGGKIINGAKPTIFSSSGDHTQEFQVRFKRGQTVRWILDQQIIEANSVGLPVVQQTIPN